MVKAASARHPAQAMGILIQNNLTELIWYVKDRTRRGLPVDANNIVLDDLHRGHMACKAYILLMRIILSWTTCTVIIWLTKPTSR
jgi:hypothetical protein